MPKSIHSGWVRLVGLLCLAANIVLCNTIILAAEGTATVTTLHSSDTAFYGYTPAEALEAEVALAQVTAQDDPETIYRAFSEFARTHFGALSEPLVYEAFGSQLALVETGSWQHISENSASLAWETNLPAYSYVEYGFTPEYGNKTEMTDRPYYLHLHQLRDLEVNQTYHYRLIAVDERGQMLVTPDRMFRTATVPDAVYVFGQMGEPPYVLDQSNTTYILKEDLVTAGSAIIVRGDHIVLDLNGYSITFGENAAVDGNHQGISVSGDSKTAIPYRATGVKVVNGTVVQGRNRFMQNNTDPYRYNCLSVSGKDMEVAGVTVVYHASQAWGMTANYSAGKFHAHHNVFVDMGAVIADRHGSGVRPLGFRSPQVSPNEFELNHNLVKRTRQNGFQTATLMHHNEVYVDSWSTNSFAIQPLSQVGIPAGRYMSNKVFATGFNPFGFGWAHEGLLIADNLIFMFGIDVKHRWGERWGDINTLEGVRVTNYDQGGQVRNNLIYENNTIVLKGKQGVELRGTGFFSDETIANLVFRNNRVRVETLDEQTTLAACVDVQGHYKKADSQPVYYVDNVFESNNAVIRFGDDYGRGNNHIFIRNRLVRLGDNPNFHTFVFDGGYHNYGHVLLDTEFTPGTAYNDVYWKKTSSKSYYSVAWTLELITTPGAEVTICDSKNREAFRGIADDTGRLEVPLTQCVMHPSEWQPNSFFEFQVLWPDKYIEESFTPYVISVSAGGKTLTETVNMTKRQTVRLIP
ncbi:MAG: hypothetical protein ACOYEP_03555 [Limnochordia bacterium]